MKNMDLSYDGQSNLKAEWQHFAEIYTANDKIKYKLEALNAFKSLLFGEKDGRSFWESGDLAMALQHNRFLRQDIYELATEISKGDAYPDTKQLFQLIINAAITQWLAVEKCHGLYPPPSINNADGVTRAEKEKVLEKRDALLRTPEGRVLYDTILFLCTPAIQLITNKSYKKYRLIHGVERTDIQAAAEDRFFKNYLFSFDAEKKDFMNNLMSRLDSDLVKRLEIDIPESAISLEKCFGDIRLDNKQMATEKQRERMTDLKSVIDRYFKQPDKEAIYLNYGIDGDDYKTAKQIRKILELDQNATDELLEALSQQLAELLKMEGYISQTKKDRQAKTVTAEHVDPILTLKARFKEIVNIEKLSSKNLAEKIGINHGALKVLFGGAANPTRNGGYSKNTTDKLTQYIGGLYGTTPDKIEEFNRVYAELKSAYNNNRLDYNDMSVPVLQ